MNGPCRSDDRSAAAGAYATDTAHTVRRVFLPPRPRPRAARGRREMGPPVAGDGRARAPGGGDRPHRLRPDGAAAPTRPGPRRATPPPGGAGPRRGTVGRPGGTPRPRRRDDPVGR